MIGEEGSSETAILLSVWRHSVNASGDNTTELCGKRWKEGHQIKQRGYKSHSKTSHMFIAWRRIIVYEHRGGLLNVEHSYVAVFRSCVSAAVSISFFGAFACEKRLLRSFLLFVRPSTRLEQPCCRLSWNFKLRICTNVCTETLGKWPTWCTITLYKTFIIIILYMFRATLCSSSGGWEGVPSQPAHRTVTDSTIPGAVLIQFDLLMMSTALLETCRGL